MITGKGGTVVIPTAIETPTQAAISPGRITQVCYLLIGAIIPREQVIEHAVMDLTPLGQGCL